MTKNIFQILAKIFVFLTISSSAFAKECNLNYSALVFNPKNGDVFFEKQSDQIIYPASLTKLMTIYLTFEAIKEKKINLQDELYVSSRAASTSKINKTNTLNLEIGDKISVEQAITGSLVKSFNELTVLLSEAISDNEWQFARDMNAKAQELGMFNTNFRNASGLHNQGQFTSDDDLAKLVLAIRKNFPEYYHYFSLKQFTYNHTKYPSHNNILLKYKGADGMKTGFTNAAGFNLIASAKREGRQVVSIVTGCDSVQKRDDLTKKLLDKAFAN
ncbi:MAG: D-alanyl-D-alanine carboxypeptidase family protein [Pseudomonadota bacterium]